MRDMFGNPLSVGDQIVYPSPRGRSVFFQMGEVIAVREDTCQVRISWRNRSDPELARGATHFEKYEDEREQVTLRRSDSIYVVGSKPVEKRADWVVTENFWSGKVIKTKRENLFATAISNPGAIVRLDFI